MYSNLIWGVTKRKPPGGKIWCLTRVYFRFSWVGGFFFRTPQHRWSTTRLHPQLELQPHLQLELQGYRGNQYPTVLGLMALPVLLSSYLECTKPQTWGGANNAIYQEWKNSPPGMHNSWDTPAGDAQIFQTSMLDWIKLLVGTITHWNHLSQVKYHH